VRAAFAIAVVTALVWVPAASASTAQISQGFYSPDTGCSKYSMCAYTYLAVTGGAGEVNDFSLTQVSSPPAVTVHDAAAPLTAGPGCTAIDANTASCSYGNTGVRVAAGDMDDSVTAGFAMTINGGPGSDAITGSLGDDQIDGGGGGIDTLNGGVGQDLLTDGDTSGAADDDVINGGPGGDILSYSSRTAPVVVNLGGKLPSGTPKGERDRVVNVEEVAGGSADDVLVAGGAFVSLNGAGGDDRLIGGPARDQLAGGFGRDRLIGNGGGDSMFGGSGDDWLSGGGGRDGLEGGSGGDRIAGEAGNDKLKGNAGADTIFGGTGGDEILAQRGDDRVFGGRGNDRISGGPGRDRMLGEGGADLFRAREHERDVVGGGPGRDRAQVDALDAVRRVESLF
jgi:Ca2+-binding RTX toxin-like protein